MKTFESKSNCLQSILLFVDREIDLRFHLEFKNLENIYRSLLGERRNVKFRNDFPE